MYTKFCSGNVLKIKKLKSSYERIFISPTVYYKPTDWPLRSWSATPALPKTQPLLPTQKELCKLSLPASHRLPTYFYENQFLKNTNILRQPSPREEYRPPYIGISAAELKSVHWFTYLGSNITSDAKFDKEIDNRLANAGSVFSRLYKCVWSNRHMKKDTKISVYTSIALVTHASVWFKFVVNLSAPPMTTRTILYIFKSDFVINTEVLESLKITSIKTMLLPSLLWWAG